jgi:hypothetical protein
LHEAGREKPELLRFHLRRCSSFCIVIQKLFFVLELLICLLFAKMLNGTIKPASETEKEKFL